MHAVLTRVICRMFCGQSCLAKACSTGHVGMHGHPMFNISSTALRQAYSRSNAATSTRRESAGTTSSADDPDALPPQAKVVLEKKDLTLRELASMVHDGELNLQPQYQRGLVWDRKMASRLVVTALEGRVVPTIYLEETEDEKYMMMDGKQRLTSLLSFVTGSTNVGGINWANAPVELDLNEDSCDPRWIGKRFQDLPKERQMKSYKYSIQCVIVSSDTDRDVVYGIYQDINTGAVGHTEQQNRKAAFHGPYIYLLDDLANNRDFLNIQGRETPDSEKEADRELALRFFAMLRSADQFKTPLMRFLNQELKTYQNADDSEIERLRKTFTETAATVWQIFGPQACRLPKADSSPSSSNSSKTKKPPDLHPSLWDATMVAVAKDLELNSKTRRKQLIQNANAIRAAYIELCADSDFKASLTNRSKAYVKRRFDMMQRMLERVAPVRSEPRLFTQQQRLELWRIAGPDTAVRLCGICNQTIHLFDDCEVDHVVPYSLGGSTNLGNAQLVHRFCNRNKGNRAPVADGNRVGSPGGVNVNGSSSGDDTGTSGDATAAEKLY